MRKKISKVMLIVPPWTHFKGNFKRCLIPFGIAYIGAVLENNGIDVKLLDATIEGYNTEIQEDDEDFITYGLTLEEIEERIRKYNPDMVGVSCLMTSQIRNVHRVCDLTKKIEKKIVVVVGGLHPSILPKETMKNKNIDFVILGEGEYRTLNLIKKLNNEEKYLNMDGLAFRNDGKVLVNPPTSHIENLDELPFPARHLLPMDKYIEINIPMNPYTVKRRVAHIFTSRGCPASCTFCASCNFWGHEFRAMSAEKVLEEIKELVKEYGVEEIQFADDNLLWDQQRVLKIFEGMKKLNLKWCTPNGVMIQTLNKKLLRKMRESGCYQLSFAVESGDKEVLHKIMKKPLNLSIVPELVKEARRLGIIVHAYFILGMPGETREQLKKSFKFAEQNEFDSCSFFIASPIPGSELYEVCKEKGMLKNDFTKETINFKFVNIENPNYKPGELEKIVSKYNRRFNIRFFIKHPLRFVKKYGPSIKMRPKELFRVIGYFS